MFIFQSTRKAEGWTENNSEYVESFWEIQAELKAVEIFALYWLNTIPDFKQERFYIK